MFKGFQISQSFGDRLYTNRLYYNVDTSRVGNIPSQSNIVTDSLIFLIDAGNSTSYPGTGTTWFDIIGSNNLTLVNSPTYQTSDGGYFSFNGTTQYANRNSPVSTANTNFSMCAWIRPASINQIGLAVHNGRETGATGDGYSFGVGNGGGSAGSKLQILFSGTAWFDSGYTYPSVNTWYYVVITRDTATLRCYVNGTQTANTSAISPSIPSNQFSVGGPDPTWGTSRFNGGVSIVQFYSKELTASEIIQNYNVYKTRFGL